MTLSGRARDLIRPYVSESQFFLWISIDWDMEKVNQAAGTTASNSTTEIMLPLSLQPMALSSDRLDQTIKRYVDPYVKKLTVDFLLDARLPAKVREIASRVLESSLPVRRDRGDEIRFQTLELGRFDVLQDLKESEQELQRLTDESNRLRTSAQAAEAKNKTIETTVETLRNRLDTLNTEISNEKSKREGAEAELEKLKREVAQKEQRPQFVLELLKFVQGLEHPIAVIILSVLAFISGIIWILIQSVFRRSQMKSLSASIQAIAEALKVAGQKKDGSGGLAKSEGGPAGKSITLADAKTSESGAEDGAPEARDDEFPTLPESEVVALNAKAQLLWESMKKALLPTLSVLKDWMADDGGKSVAFVLSQVDSQSQLAILNGLSTKERERVVKCLGRAPAAGQGASLSIRLYQEARIYLAGRPAWVSEINDASFLRIDDDGYKELVSRVSEKEAALLLYLLTPKRSAGVMSNISQRLVKPIVELMQACPKMPRDEALSAIGALNAAVAELLGAESDALWPQMVAIYESATEDIRQEVQTILQADPRMFKSLMKAVLSIEKIFSLDSESLSDIFEPYGPEDLAILLTGLPPHYVEKFQAVLSRSGYIGLQSELSRIQNRPYLKRRALVTGRRLQRDLISRVRVLEKAGFVDFSEQAEQVSGALKLVNKAS